MNLQIQYTNTQLKMNGTHKKENPNKPSYTPDEHNKTAKQEAQTLKAALEGDINAFQQCFAKFQPQLKSYLYRLTASRNDADDLTHDTFIRAYDKLNLFKGESSLKTWVFQIATNLAYNYLQKRKRWTVNVNAEAKELVSQNPALVSNIQQVANNSPEGRYTIREHIDTCFTCMGKTLPIENQVAVILKDIYDFSVPEITRILSKSEGTVKYLLQNARKTMTDIFEKRCALVNQEGICHQCSELNGWFNPKQDQQAARMELDLVKGSKKYDRDQLYQLRTQLIRHIDPLRTEGNALQEALMECNRIAVGEANLPS